jgi:hypothetical protein
MRSLKSHFRHDALPTLETVLKQTKEARVFRRAQAVREVVAGHHVNTVPHSHSPPWSIGHAGVRSLCSMKTKWFSGALPCPARAGGAKHSVLASPPPPESKSDQTRRRPQTSSVAPVSLVEPHHQWCVAQRHWCGPIWYIQSLL